MTQLPGMHSVRPSRRESRLPIDPLASQWWHTSDEWFSNETNSHTIPIWLPLVPLQVNCIKTLKMATRIEESAAMTSKNIIEEEKRQTIFLLYTEQQMNCNKSKNTLWNISYFASLLLWVLNVACCLSYAICYNIKNFLSY